MPALFRLTASPLSIEQIDGGPDWLTIDDATSASPISAALSGNNYSGGGGPYPLHASASAARFPVGANSFFRGTEYNYDQSAHEQWGGATWQTPQVPLQATFSGLGAGTVTVVVYIRDGSYTATGARIFAVTANGGGGEVTLAAALDPVAAFGAATVGAVQADVTVTGAGILTVSCVASADAACWTAIEILEAEASGPVTGAAAVGAAAGITVAARIVAAQSMSAGVSAGSVAAGRGAFGLGVALGVTAGQSAARALVASGTIGLGATAAVTAGGVLTVQGAAGFGILADWRASDTAARVFFESVGFAAAAGAGASSRQTHAASAALSAALGAGATGRVAMTLAVPFAVSAATAAGRGTIYAETAVVAASVGAAAGGGRSVTGAIALGAGAGAAAAGRLGATATAVFTAALDARAAAGLDARAAVELAATAALLLAGGASSDGETHHRIRLDGRLGPIGLTGTLTIRIELSGRLQT